jgi:hypothetical protein
MERRNRSALLPDASSAARLRNPGSRGNERIRTRSGNGDGGLIHKTAWDAAAPAVHVRFRCEVVSTTREGVLEQLAEILGGEGYFVSKKIAGKRPATFGSE